MSIFDYLIIRRFLGAGEGIRTLDFNLGKVAEYSKALPFLKETIPFFVEKMNQY